MFQPSQPQGYPNALYVAHLALRVVVALTFFLLYGGLVYVNTIGEVPKWWDFLVRLLTFGGGFYGIPGAFLVTVGVVVSLRVTGRWRPREEVRKASTMNLITDALYLAAYGLSMPVWGMLAFIFYRPL